MAKGFYKAVCKIVSKLGFEYWKSGKGSHEKWRNAVTGKVLLLPRNMKSRHTANGILKDSGSSKRF